MLKRLLSFAILLAFGGNALAPGLLHGCQGSWRDESAMTSMAGMHHGEPAEGKHHQRSQHEGHSHSCQCVGHSCCYTMAALSSTVGLPAPLVLALGTAAAPKYLSALLTRPSHLLPSAQAPPTAV